MLNHTGLCRKGLSTYSTNMRSCTSVYVHLIANCRLSSKPSATIRAFERQHEISNNVVCATGRSSDQPALMCSLIRAFACSLEYSRILKQLTEHDLECLSLKGDFTGSSESAHVKMPHCLKSHVTAHL